MPRKGDKKGKKGRKFFRRLLALIGILVIAWIAVVATVNGTSRSYRFGNTRDLPHAPVAVVLGAYVYQNSVPTPMLKDRLDGAIELYNKGLVKKLVMSGDDEDKYYNEVKVMHRYAVKHGVPESAIIDDPKGYDTYDTCYNVRKKLGIKKAIFVTQGYHAPRAVFIARAFGIDAVCYALPDWDKYPTFSIPYTTREWLADVKAMWFLYVWHPTP